MTNLTDMNKRELVEVAKEKKIKNYGTLSKEQLLTQLQELKVANEQEPTLFENKVVEKNEVVVEETTQVEEKLIMVSHEPRTSTAKIKWATPRTINACSRL